MLLNDSEIMFCFFFSSVINSYYHFGKRMKKEKKGSFDFQMCNSHVNKVILKVILNVFYILVALFKARDVLP